MSEQKFITIGEVQPGKSYACKFKVQTMVDMNGKPHPNLTDVPLKGVTNYIGLGIMLQRDSEKKLVKLKDTESKKEFVVSFDDIWDIDEAEFSEEFI
tara:strand:+ start:289 stop:579 length:291 start_codon:yes stop_codon:yes gene_type:complete